MRIPLVAGNWKMNKTVAEARDLVTTMRPKLGEIANVEKVLCPPFFAVPALAEMLRGSGIGLGAQNLHWEEKGAFTGEVSSGMVKEFCNYVIIGHSERRTYFGETDETVNKRTLAALAKGLIAIVCIGETLSENEAGQTAAVIERQVRDGLRNIPAEQLVNLVIAYEPVWAIGTGKVATPEIADTMHKSIRETIKKKYNDKIADEISILYGGSVKPENIAELYVKKNIDGVLVGGASLKIKSFLDIINVSSK